ncbi:hypothetical protein ACOSQ4_006979 [Xanthoceras sorbifolium]
MQLLMESSKEKKRKELFKLHVKILIKHQRSRSDLSHWREKRTDAKTLDRINQQHTEKKREKEIKKRINKCKLKIDKSSVFKSNRLMTTMNRKISSFFLFPFSFLC